jgi:CBS domain-containing protein
MHSTLVRDVMGTDVPVVSPATPFKELVTVLRARRANAVVVMGTDDSAGQPVGIITPADLIIKRTDPEGRGLQAARPCPVSERRKATGTVAGEMMSAPTITVFPHTTVAEAARVMRRHVIAQLPVIAPSSGQVVGIVTRFDVLGAYLRADDEIQEEITKEIVCGEFAADAADVTVTTVSGVVTLTGQVRSRGAVPRLIHAAKQVEGVVTVQDHLSCRGDDRFPVPPLAW